MLTLLSVAATCRETTPAHRGDKGNGDKSNAVSGLRQAQVEFNSDGKILRVDVEVAQTDEDRAKGLMFRRQLGERSGMLFLFDRQEVLSFWMRNTYIPLDMIFIDESLHVVGVVHRAEPLTETSRHVERPARYVVEVNAGFASQHNIKPGTSVRLLGLKPDR